MFTHETKTKPYIETSTKLTVTMDYGTEVITIERHNPEEITEFFDVFERFLKACSFHVDGKHIDLVDTE